MPTTFANTIDGNDIYAKRAECDAAGNDLSTTYATKSELPALYMGLNAGSNITITEGQDSITISATDTTYSAGTGLSLSGTTFSNSDPLPAHTSTESGKVLGVDSNGDLGWVNQSGGGGSYSAGNGIDITNDVISVDTSVVATQTDLADKEDAFDVGTGLEMDTSGATPTLQVEAPVDIVAGPGIVIDNPDGNTLRVSVDQAIETVLWENSSGEVIGANQYITLSESLKNFERVVIYYALQPSWGGKLTYELVGVGGNVPFCLNQYWYREQSGYNNYWQTIMFNKYDDTTLRITNIGGEQGPIHSTSWGTTSGLVVTMYKVVGIHRIANN